jgi:phenylalanyl-tRNA synthetase beta chain
MRVPLSWLKDYVPSDIPAKELAERLTFAGLEVEEVVTIGLSDDHNGGLILPPAAAAGTPLAEIVGPPETVLVVEVTPNRPDCLSLIGMAREVAALFGVSMRLPEIRLQESDPAIEQLTAVAVRDSEGCPRYTARVIRGVAIGPSPRWMQRRLTLAGVRPINNIVDVTNYVMLECGQPLHAFDQELLAGGRINVRRAAPGESLATLDGVPRPITPEMLVIADAEKAVAIAGVMGGAGSEIRPTTANVLLESACFKATDIRRTSKQLGLATESSYRYERGVDPYLAEWTSRRAAALMTEVAGGRVARGVIDCFPRPPAAGEVTLRYDRARELLGIELDNAGMRRICESLALNILHADERACRVAIPSFRMDLEREADVIEEVARIHGLAQVPAAASAARMVARADDAPCRAQILCRRHLTGLGLTEIMHYSFVSEKLLDRFDPGDAAERIVLPNPTSAEHTVLRTALVGQMVATLGANRARQIQDAALFEMGRVFRRDAAGGEREELRLCIGLMGCAGRIPMEKRQPPQAAEVFQWLKGLFEELCRLSRGPRKRWKGMERLAADYAPVRRPYYADDTAVAILLENEPVGAMGLIAADLLSDWRIADPVAVLDIAADRLLAHQFDVPVTQPLPVYPSVARDLAVVVGEHVQHQDVAQAMMKAAPEELVDIRLFDIYRGAGVGAERKSLAYSLTYQSRQRTLTDEEANAMHAAVTQAVIRELKAELRA